jgi:CHAT domain-containing protein/Tfp pilus assembly protein PilF
MRDKMRPFSHLLCRLLLGLSFCAALISSPIYAQSSQKRVKQLAQNLLKAPSTEEQNHIFSSHKEIALELLEELDRQASQMFNKQRYSQSQAACDLILRLSPQIGAKVRLSEAYRLKGKIKFKQSLYTEALALFNTSLRIATEIGDKKELGLTHGSLGTLLLNQGEYQRALEHFLNKLTLSQQIQYDEGIIKSLLQIGSIYRYKGNYLQALEYFQKSLKTAETSPIKGTKQDIARAHLHIGIIFRNLGDYPQSMDYYNRSLKGFQAIGSEHGVARVLHNIAVLHRKQGNPTQALELHLKSLKISEEIKDREGFIKSLIHITNIHIEQGNYAQARDYYQKCMKSLEQLADSASVAPTNTDGTLYDEQSNYPQTLDYYQRTLRIEEKIGNRPVVARILNTIGAFYNSQGNYMQALEHHYRSLQIREQIGDKQGVIFSLNSIGIDHNCQQNYWQALNYHRRALKLSEQINDKNSIAESLKNIGNVYQNQSNYTQALNYYLRSLEIREQIGDKIGVATTLSSIGYFHRSQKSFEKAIDYFQKALKILETSNSQATRAVTVIGLGLTYFDQVNSQRENIAETRTALNKSHNYLLDGLSICRVLGLSPHEAEALRGLAMVEAGLSRWNESLTYIEASIKIIESIRMNVSDSRRISYFSSVQSYYNHYIRSLMELHKIDPSKGYLNKAFLAADRSRARALVEFLTQPDMHLVQHLRPGVIEEKRRLEQEIDLKSEEQFKLLSSADKRVHTTERKLEALIKEYEEIQFKIRDSNPKYAAIMQPSPLTLQAIQQAILDKDTILIQYHLDEVKSYAWVISAESIVGVELPGRSRIEESARRFYDTLTARTRQLTVENLEKESSREFALELGKMILDPFKDHLGKRRILIVADGALNSIPFSALTLPADKNQILLYNSEIVNLPSASTLLALNNAHKSLSQTNKITVFADPVFDKKDRRVAATANNRKVSIKRDKLLSLETDTALPRLEYTRRLVEEIQNITPQSDLEAFVDFDASRQRLMNADLSSSQIIVFATHGVVYKNPEDSGLILSRVDKQGNPQDGFLQLKDVYKLRLNANLVVLGACETAIGEEIKGEGVISLTRGFMYAGAKGVMASLWKVDEAATVELIRRMYENLRRGRNASEALRLAQTSLRNEKRFADPYYWSGFVLMGDWRN